MHRTASSPQTVKQQWEREGAGPLRGRCQHRTFHLVLRSLHLMLMVLQGADAALYHTAWTGGI